MKPWSEREQRKEKQGGLFNLAERSKFGEFLNGECKKWTELPLILTRKLYHNHIIGRRRGGGESVKYLNYWN